MKISLILCIALLYVSGLFSQQKVIDQIIAVVGDDVVLQSEIENQIMQMRTQGIDTDEDLSCQVLEQMLVQKLLLNQAKVDSIVVSPLQIEEELNRRLEYFIDQIGSKKRLEEYYKKSTIEIKEDLRDMIGEQLLAETMQQNILGKIKVTPAEVNDFYNTLPQDSLPIIESKLELRQIVTYPPFSDEAVYDARQKLLDLRKRIIEGERFSTLAVLYSEDPSTASKGGELGMVSKDELVPEFSKAAMKLKKGNVSNIIQTEFGYHIIQLIDKEDTRFNVRHILMKPKISYEDKRNTINKLDSISKVIKLDSITFEKAAKIFTEDPKSKLNGGIMVNPATYDTKFKISELNKADYFAIKTLKVDEVSEPFETVDEKGKIVFKIIQIKSQSTPHRANINEDYQVIQDMVKNQKQQKIIKEWLEDKQSQAFIHINDKYINCQFESKGWVK